MTPNADSGRVIWRNYRPANGTENDYFAVQTCYRCARDHQWHIPPYEADDSCPIIMDSLVGEHAYPNEDGPPQWSYDPATGEGWCSEFEGPCECECEWERDAMRSASPNGRSEP
jgi:hypothetical protein